MLVLKRSMEQTGDGLCQSLATKNITLCLCGVTPEHNGKTNVTYAVFIGLTGVTVFLRLLARFLTKAYFWWDDLFN